MPSLIEPRLQQSRHGRGADIPGDMVVEIALRDAERSERGREAVARMVADENDAGIARGFDQFVSFGLIGPDEVDVGQGKSF